ncbi:hypothetical protein BMS3Bbin14_00199 [bacterium BMS3Bbin14]|nr:hypothetical protein BMS3Abin13_00487 [bacterium BMS3Abin13]GBE51745.1 hypothetical protein BMS3Bbin14_00199 [bacterium BMS3Bbin14]
MHNAKTGRYNLQGRNIIVLMLLSFFLASPAHAAEFSLLYANDVRGKTKPCG